jgi:protein involved in polysaccharide export with SLBB domain
MTVNDLIIQSGGLKYSATSSFIEIARRTLDDPKKTVEIIQLNSNKNLINADSIKKINLFPFDHVFIRNIPGYYAPYIVTIKGEVLLPGDFAVDRKEMRISDLIKRANGLTQYAYTPGATLLRRTNKFKNLTKAERENENLNEIKLNINKDQIVASSETNKSTTSRIDEKVKENNKTI